MERRRLIVVVASALMILAFIGLPVISVSTFGFSATMLEMLFKNSSVMFVLLQLLMLLAPIYLILDVYRDRLTFMEKIKIPAKIASLIPVVCFIFFTIVLSSGSGRGIKPDKDSGFYIYLLASIVVAVLPYVKHPSLEK